MESATSLTRVSSCLGQGGTLASSRKRGIPSPAIRSKPAAQMARRHKAKVVRSTIMRHRRQARPLLEKKTRRTFRPQHSLVPRSCLDSRRSSIGHSLKVKVHEMLRTARTTTKSRQPLSRMSSMHARTTTSTTAWRWWLTTLKATSKKISLGVLIKSRSSSRKLPCSKSKINARRRSRVS